MLNNVCYSLLVCLLLACSTPVPKQGFELLSPQKTGIDFQNDLLENDTLNYHVFPYLYMGGGVSAADFNNDGLDDLYFTSNLYPNKLYINKGNLEFEDITKSAGVAGDKRWYTGTTVLDINADGLLDLYLCVAGKFTTTENQLFVNQGNGTFLEQAKKYGLNDPAASIQATAFDYNQDGLQDLFVANYPLVPVSMGNHYYKMKMDDNQFSESGHLYQNNGNGTFLDVTKNAGVQNFGLTLGVVASDLNDDGLTDLYLSNDFNVPDYLYLNNGDGTFTESLKAATNQTSMFGMGLDIADFNNDLLPDILQVDMTPEDHFRSKTNMASMSPSSFYTAVDYGFHYQYMQNSLQLHQGVKNNIPYYGNIARLTGLATTDWSWTGLFADVNNDGLRDIYITNGMKRDVNNNDVNQQLKEQSFFGQIENYDPEIYPSNPIANYLYINEGELSLSNETTPWGVDQPSFSNGATYADLDNDGDLDLIVNNIDAPAFIYKNRTEGNAIQIRLSGPATNPIGLNAKVRVVQDELQQVQELTLSRGFQSSVSTTLHFGLPNENPIEVTVTWPDGNVSSFSELSPNQIFRVDYSQSEPALLPPGTTHTYRDQTSDKGLTFAHQEDEYDDFKNEPLLPHKNSQVGPALARGDLNGDGLEDLFFGNAAGASSQVYLQQHDGTWKLWPGPWQQDSDQEDTGALIFDGDGDGDMDLYVACGGNDPSKPANYYRDRMYVNIDGQFHQAKANLPNFITSGKVVKAADYDQDGDLDLLVAGRIVPGKYPQPALSALLRNDSQPDQLRFTDVTDELCPDLRRLGLITDATWQDIDTDGDSDLILVGEWLPITIFENKAGEFHDNTDAYRLAKTRGWWNSIYPTDMDGDGDTDYLVGNLGLNYKYKASAEQPFEIFSNDFDENNQLDIVIAYEKKGKMLPLRGRECSSQQIPAIKSRFKTYEAFAGATLDEIYGEYMLETALHYEAQTFANSWLENTGDGFELHELPPAAQLSSINAFVQLKPNSWLAAGNKYPAEVETPRNDASYGVVLTYDREAKEFSVLPPQQSGIYLQGECKALTRLQPTRGPAQIIAAMNDDQVRLLTRE